MYLSDKQVAERYGVARVTPWRWAKTGSTFPRPVELSPGCTRWNLDELIVWEEKKASSNSLSSTSQSSA